MADVELLIKIPEEVKVAVTRMGLIRIPVEMQKIIDRAIQHSTPLPKGHGDLKDADEIKKNQFTLATSNYCEYKVVKTKDIDNTDTIIEADKVESEAQE